MASNGMRPSRRFRKTRRADLLLLLLRGSPLQPALPRIDTQTPRTGNFLSPSWLLNVIGRLIVFMLDPETQLFV